MRRLCPLGQLLALGNSQKINTATATPRRLTRPLRRAATTMKFQDTGAPAAITRVAGLACAMTIVGAGPSFAQVPDPNTYYRLSTEFRGTDSVLDVFNGGPQNNLTHLAPFQN